MSDTITQRLDPWDLRPTRSAPAGTAHTLDGDWSATPVSPEAISGQRVPRAFLSGPGAKRGEGEVRAREAFTCGSGRGVAALVTPRPAQEAGA